MDNQQTLFVTIFKEMKTLKDSICNGCEQVKFEGKEYKMCDGNCPAQNLIKSMSFLERARRDALSS